MAAVAAMLLCSCSGGGDQEKEKGKIEAMNEKAAQEAVKAIKTPIDNAQAVTEQEARRVKEMEGRIQDIQE